MPKPAYVSRCSMRSTLPAWLIAGLSLTMAVACAHALIGYILDTRTWGTLGQRTDTQAPR